jgi:hypothetical protein
MRGDAALRFLELVLERDCLIATIVSPASREVGKEALDHI